MFEFDGRHVLLAAIGACIAVAYWLPRFISEREPVASALLLLTGAGAFSLLPGIPRALDPTDAASVWEAMTEIAVIVALFGAGLRIDNVFVRASWEPAVRLLLVCMPLTIAAVTALGFTVTGLTLAGAVLLGAVLSPTDPVLAGDLQVGPPLEGREHPVRFALTTEAGLNDGLAFPFVLLALLIAAEGFAPGNWAFEWVARDLVYRVVAGALVGAGIGWLLGKLTFAIPRQNALAASESGVVALAGVLLAYGATELLEGYGFVAAFVMAIALRREEQDHPFHRRLHAFSESIEHAVTAVILVLLGGTLPLLWPALQWQHAAVGALLLLVIRPLAGWLSLLGTRLGKRERAIVSFYGIRGIGSLYYLGYASAQVELVDERALWATVAYTVLASTIVHGLTASATMERVAADAGPPRAD